MVHCRHQTSLACERLLGPLVHQEVCGHLWVTTSPSKGLASGWLLGVFAFFGDTMLNKLYPLVICYIAIEHGPVEIVSLPMNSMVIFHFAMETFTRGYQPFLAMYETYINHI